MVANDDSGLAGFSYCLLNCFTCDSTGATEPTFSDGLSWSDLSAAYAKLSSANQSTLLNATANKSGELYEQAVARYDYIVAKYGTTSYENFIGRSISSSSNIIGNKYVSNNTLVIVVLIASLGVFSVGMYFFLKKKKYE